MHKYKTTHFEKGADPTFTDELDKKVGVLWGAHVAKRNSNGSRWSPFDYVSHVAANVPCLQ
jgi:hypothetical protein